MEENEKKWITDSEQDNYNKETITKSRKNLTHETRQT